MRVQVIWLALFSSLVAGSASGQGIMVEHELKAWSADGKAALLTENEYGPEGGGALSLWIVDFTIQDPTGLE